MKKHVWPSYFVYSELGAMMSVTDPTEKAKAVCKRLISLGKAAGPRGKQFMGKVKKFQGRFIPEVIPLLKFLLQAYSLGFCKLLQFFLSQRRKLEKQGCTDLHIAAL